MENKSESILNKLCMNGYESYIVGGYVRDLFLDNTSNDIDIATSATSDIIENLFIGQQIKTVGKSFNVVLINGIEIATFRKDVYYGLSDKNVDISIANSIYEDLERRDLTINSMAYCPYTGHVIDPFNGREDLKNKIIRFTGNPEDRIKEDPNRIIRACRFKALLNAEFGEDTKQALINNAHLLMEFVDKKRMRLEILKAMKIKYASLFFKALREIDALQYIFETLDHTFEYDDIILHGKYHNESIIDHCLMCGDNLSTKNPLLKLAGYLHDVGKPIACKVIDNEVSFLRHEDLGECYVELDLKQLQFSNQEIHYIKSLVGLHMRQFKTPKSIRKLMVVLNEKNISWKHLYQLKMADSKANLKRNGHSKEKIKQICLDIFNELYKKESVNKFSDLNINGKEIMEITNIKPGKQVGEIKNKLFDIVIDRPELNKNDTLRRLVHNCWVYMI